MTYILAKDRSNDSLEEWDNAWSAYCRYLASVRQYLPRNAYEFATAPWHYNFEDHMSPHDSWHQSTILTETPVQGAKYSKLDISVRLLGAFHDGHIELRFENVRSCDLRAAFRQEGSRSDWLYDEVRLSESGHVLHEIEWSNKDIWLIECDELQYSWIPLSLDRSHQNTAEF